MMTPKLSKPFFVLLVGTLLSLLLPETLMEAHCEESSLTEQDLENVKQLNFANKSEQALFVADSLLEVVLPTQYANCPITMWLQLEKGQSLEIETEFLSALQLYYALIKDGEQHKQWEIVANAYISIARCHEFLGRPSDCRRNLDIAKAYIDDYKLYAALGRYSIRFSSYHRIFSSVDSALVLAKQGIEYGVKYNPDRYIVDGYLLVGILAPEIDTAILHLRQAIELFVDIKDYEAALSMRLNIVSKYFSEANYEAAAMELDSIEQCFPLLDLESAGYAGVMSRYYNQRRTVYTHHGLVDSAYHNLQKSIAYERKADWIVDQEEVSKNAVAFAIEKEHHKAKELRRIGKIQQTANVLLSLLAILSILFGLFFFDRRRKVAQQNAIITQRNQELNYAMSKQSLLLSEVHHRVKNNLQLVISLLTFQGNRCLGSKEFHLLNDVSNKVRSISLIHEQLYGEGEFERIGFSTYLTSLCAHFGKLQTAGSPFKFIINAEELYFNLDTVLPLGIICSELISNSMKHGSREDLIIKICLEQIETSYSLKYSDNGPGYNFLTEKVSKNSMGLDLIKSMVRQLQAQHSFFNRDGASFTMMFVEKSTSSYVK